MCPLNRRTVKNPSVETQHCCVSFSSNNSLPAHKHGMKKLDTLKFSERSPQGGIIEPTATGVPGKPVFGLLGQVSGG